MTVGYNPSIPTSNLSLYLDAANKKSYSSGENLLIRSQEFNTGWSTLNTSINPNTAIAPDGTLTADLITNTPSQLSYIGQNTFISANTTYTISVYVKPVTTNKIIAIELDTTGGGTYIVPVYNLDNLTTSGGGTKSIVNVGNGWYRIICTFTTSAGTPKFNVFYIGAYGSTPDTVSMYLWGAQLEKSSTANTYVATTTSATSQSTSWIDLSGNGNTGTLINGPVFNNFASGTLSFNGTSSYVQIANSSSLNQPLNTIICWARSNTANWNSDGMLMSKRDVFVMHPDSGSRGVTPYYRLNNIWVSIGQLLPSDITVWNMYASVWNGTTFNTYLNGNKINSSSAYSGQSLNTSDTGVMEIAKDDGISRYLDGSISQAVMYSIGLTDSQIFQYFTATRSRYGI